MVQLVYGDKPSVDATSDESLADEDIEHKNLTIRKEAEATWEVSQSLSISFDCEKENLLEVFMDLEHKELKRKKSRALKWCFAVETGVCSST